MRRVACRVFLAVLVVLAGCSGGQTPGSTTVESRATTTQTPTTAQSTASTTATTPTGKRLAPGVTRAGVVNASRLVAAHVAALNASGYEHRVRLATAMEIPEANGTVTSSLTRRVRATPEWDAYRLRTVHVEADADAGRRTTRVEWSNGTVGLLRVETGNRTAYERLGPVGPGGAFEREVRLTSRLALHDFLRRGDYRVESVASRNGSTRTTLVADSAPNATDFSATAVVDGAGRIRRLNATTTMQVAGNRTTTRTLQYRLVRLGVKYVERPAWVDDALAAPNATA